MGVSDLVLQIVDRFVEPLKPEAKSVSIALSRKMSRRNAKAGRVTKRRDRHASPNI
jgi:hypothetical protein